MNCPACGARMEKGWGFCPRCGSRVSGDFFEEIFSRMRKELSEMNRMMEKDVEAFDLSPWFRGAEKKNSLKEGGAEGRRRPLTPSVKGSAFLPRAGSGFTIKIVQSGNGKPDISVRTFGDVDRSEIKKGMEEIGVPQTGKPARRGFLRPSPKQQVVLRSEMKTEEPKTSVARSASKVVVSIQLPGVKSEKDIEVCELENSIEVKALAHDRAYFKILTKPSQFRLARRSFEKGVLELEFS